MGKRGPKPTPTKILKMRGSWRAKRNPDEPQYPVSVPTCPGHLNEEARKEWKRITRLLKVQGLITLVDRAALTCYCEAWSGLVRATEKVNQMGEVLKSKETGVIYQNPYLAIKNKAMEQINKFSSLFGLSPSSRVGLKTNPPVPTAPNDKSRFFRGC
jgi:P27 family predicted phage terminase small subunit